jgi:hypothetical protein
VKLLSSKEHIVVSENITGSASRDFCWGKAPISLLQGIYNPINKSRKALHYSVG